MCTIVHKLPINASQVLSLLHLLIAAHFATKMKLQFITLLFQSLSFTFSQPPVKAKPTCEDCNALVSAISGYLTSKPGLDRQVEVLLSKACPKMSSPDECREHIPKVWPKLAGQLWPGYYNPSAEWMCGKEDFCGGPDARWENYNTCHALKEILSYRSSLGFLDWSHCLKIFQNVITQASHMCWLHSWYDT